MAFDNGSTATPSAGWTKYNQADRLDSVAGAVFYRVANGSDALTITLGTAGNSAIITYAIAGANALNGSSAGAQTQNPNPPAHTASHINKQYLFIAFLANYNFNYAATAAPSGYANLVTKKAAAGCAASTATKDSVLGVDDPGTFTLASTLQTLCWTLAVYNNP
jgi:hypothetical protein